MYAIEEGSCGFVEGFQANHSREESIGLTRSPRTDSDCQDTIKAATVHGPLAKAART